MLSVIAAEGMKGNEPLVAIERHAPWITIGVFDGGSFLYGHAFETANEDDFTYHLLAVVNQFGMADRQPIILLDGAIAQGDACSDRAAASGGTVVLDGSSRFSGVRVPGRWVEHPQ